MTIPILISPNGPGHGHKCDCLHLFHHGHYGLGKAIMTHPFKEKSVGKTIIIVLKAWPKFKIYQDSFLLSVKFAVPDRGPTILTTVKNISQCPQAQNKGIRHFVAMSCLLPCEDIFAIMLY